MNTKTPKRQRDGNTERLRVRVRKQRCSEFNLECLFQTHICRYYAAYTYSHSFVFYLNQRTLSSVPKVWKLEEKWYVFKKMRHVVYVEVNYRYKTYPKRLKTAKCWIRHETKLIRVSFDVWSWNEPYCFTSVRV